MLAMMRERGYAVNKRNRDMEKGTSSDGSPQEGEDYVMLRDFETGKMMPVPRAKGGRI